MNDNNNDDDETIVFHKITLDIDDDLIEKLLIRAKIEILHDRDVLLNYIINKVLLEKIENEKKHENK